MKALPAFLAGTVCAVCATVALQSFAQKPEAPSCKLDKTTRDQLDSIELAAGSTRRDIRNIQGTLEKIDTRVGDLWAR
jgi:hypothetical protein